MIESKEILDVLYAIKKLDREQLDREIRSLTDEIEPLVDKLELLQLMMKIRCDGEAIPPPQRQPDNDRPKPGGSLKGPRELSENFHKVHAFMEVNGPSAPASVVESTGIKYQTVISILNDTQHFMKKRRGIYSLKAT